MDLARGATGGPAPAHHRFRPHTLRGRLTARAAAVVVVGVVVLTVVFDVALVSQINRVADDDARSRATAAAATLGVENGQLTGVDDLRTDVGVGRSDLWVFHGTTSLVAPPSAGPAVNGHAADLAGQADRFLRLHEEDGVVLASAAVRDSGQRQVGTVVAGVALDTYDRNIRSVVVASVLLAGVLLLFVLLLMRVLVGRALTPVAEMTAQARDWSERGTDARFGEVDRPGELAALAGVLDALLDRSSAVLRREQQLSAEISHELRTPLAAIAAEADLFRIRERDSEEGHRAMVMVGAAARRMDGILSALLAAARAGATPDLGRCDPREAVQQAIDEFGRTVRLEAASGLPDVGADTALVIRALTPLLENACRYARTGVVVRIQPGVLVEVLDDGPGVPRGQAEAVFDAGRRLDPSDGHDGAGLGLALARRLARACDGDLWCDDTAAGGHFVLRLPPA